MRRLAVTGICAAIALSACGGSDDQTGAYTKAFSIAFQHQTKSKLTVTEADCVAPEVLKVLPAKVLSQRKIVVGDVAKNVKLKDLALKPTAVEATSIADAYVRCVDVGRLGVNAAKESNANIATDVTRTACLTKQLRSMARYRDQLRDSIQGYEAKPTDSDAKALVTAFGECRLEFFTTDTYAETFGKKNLEKGNAPVGLTASTCLAREVVRTYSVTTLESKGILPDTMADADKEIQALFDGLTPDQILKFSHSIRACVDLNLIFGRVLRQTVAGTGIPKALGDCIITRILEATEFKTGIARSFLGDQKGGLAALGERLGRDFALACLAKPQLAA